MSENKPNTTYTYTYSARQQAEIDAIRKKYLPPEEDKMAQLRRLDDSVESRGALAALALGIPSTLVLGVGMCCTMVWQGAWFIPGIVIGLIGMAGAALSYPLYKHVTKKQREKIAPEILRLTEELLK